jgi:hypothetical protein
MNIFALLGIFLVIAVLFGFLTAEGFAQYNSYRKYYSQKLKSDTLCDPDYDRNCKTDYTMAWGKKRQPLK